MEHNRITERLRVLEHSGFPGSPAAEGAEGAEGTVFASGRYAIRVANDLESRGKAYRLVYRLYLEREYTQPHPSRMRLSLFDLLPETATLLVERAADGAAVGALTAIFDSPLGLPADNLYRPELDALRAQGRRLCEFASLAVAEEGEDSSAVLVELYSRMSIFAREVRGATDIVITVNPRHAGFYRRTLLFEDLGPEREYGKVGGAPAVLQRLDFAVQRESIRREHAPRPEGARRSRVLYRLFHPLNHEAAIRAGLEQAFCPMRPQEIEHFCAAREDLLAEATPEQRGFILQACLVLKREEYGVAQGAAPAPGRPIP